MATGLPIICFEKASGFAEVIRDNPGIGRVCSANHIQSAEGYILQYLENEELTKHSSNASRQLIQDTYSMQLYAGKLETI